MRIEDGQDAFVTSGNLLDVGSHRVPVTETRGHGSDSVLAEYRPGDSGSQLAEIAGELVAAAAPEAGMLSAEIDLTKSPGTSQQASTASRTAISTYIEKPEQLPDAKPVELPDWIGFENPIYRHEVEFNQKPDGTWMQVRLRAKDGSRHSSYIGQFRIGRLTDRQLKKVGKRTLPTDVKEAIADGELEYDLIREILTRPGKGGNRASQKGKKRVSAKGARTGSTPKRTDGLGRVDRTAGRKTTDRFPAITQSQRIN